MFKMTFEYDKNGRGMLKLFNDETLKKWWYARTGSINLNGELVNSISKKTWYIITRPEIPTPEEYDLMSIKAMDGYGWKWRLHERPSEKSISHILIHPDGSKNNLHDGNGTLGCIGLNENATELFSFGMELYHKEPKTIIKIEVS